MLDIILCSTLAGGYVEQCYQAPRLLEVVVVVVTEHEILDISPRGPAGANTLHSAPLGPTRGNMAPTSTTFNFGISNVMYYTVYGRSLTKQIEKFQEACLSKHSGRH